MHHRLVWLNIACCLVIAQIMEIDFSGFMEADVYSYLVGVFDIVRLAQRHGALTLRVLRVTSVMSQQSTVDAVLFETVGRTGPRA